MTGRSNWWSPSGAVSCSALQNAASARFDCNTVMRFRSVLGQPMDAVFDQVCDEHEAHGNRKFTRIPCNQGKFECCSSNPQEGGHQGLHSRIATSHQRSTTPQTSNVVCLNFEVCRPSPRGVRRVLHRASNQEGVPPRFSNRNGHVIGRSNCNLNLGTMNCQPLSAHPARAKHKKASGGFFMQANGSQNRLL